MNHIPRLETVAKHTREERDRVVAVVSANESLKSQVVDLRADSTELTGRMAKSASAVEFIEKVALGERLTIKSRIEGVATNALQCVFGEDYSVEFDYDMRNNRTAVEIMMVKKCGDMKVRRDINGIGGGVADVIALPLKVIVLLRTAGAERLLLADEPGKHIDEERVERFFQFLKSVSEELNMQMIICTHHACATSYADVIHRVSIDKGVSKVESVKVNDKPGFLKRARLTNYESHKDTTIEFGGGLNIIVGKSDVGKSSVVRGIATAACNRWEKDNVRSGEDKCRVEIESAKGMVVTERGERTNRWYVALDGKGETYEKVGRGLPPGVAEATGIHQLDMDDISDCANIMFQLDKHYMMSEIDGKKATGNMVARVVDKALGLGGVETLIKDISGDGARAKRKLSDNEGRISELKTRMRDDPAIDEMRTKLVDMELLLQESMEAHRAAVAANTVYDEWNTLHCGMNGKALKIKELSAAVISPEEALKVADKVLVADLVAKTLKEWQDLEARSKANASLLTPLLGVSSLTPLSNAVAQEVNEMNTAYESFFTLNERLLYNEGRLREYETVKGVSDASVAEVKESMTRQTELKKAFAEYDSVKGKLSGNKYLMVTVKHALKEAEAELAELHKGCCPTCGRSFDEPKKHVHKRKSPEPCSSDDDEATVQYAFGDEE